jgi:hypothetical protein
MRTMLRKFTIAGLILLVFLFTYLCGKTVVRKVNQYLVDEEMTVLTQSIGLDWSKSKREVFVDLRELFHANSRNIIDEEFWSYNQDHPKLLRMLIDASNSDSYSEDIKYPHMECATRSGVLSKLLQTVNIPSKIVVVFAPLSEFPSHVFLEIFNSDRNSWEIYDPSYDISYIRAGENTVSAPYLSLAELIELGADEVIPCNSVDCGWGSITDTAETKSEDLKKYLALAVRADKVGFTTFVNKAVFPLEEKFLVNSAQLDFCAYRPGYCEKIVTFD